MFDMGPPIRFVGSAVTGDPLPLDPGEPGTGVSRASIDAGGGKVAAVDSEGDDWFILKKSIRPTAPP